jgi:hypothetical protein
MIKNPEILEKFELELMKREKPDFQKNLAIYESMYELARYFGVFPLKDPLEGLDEKIEYVRRLHVSKNT